MKAIAVTLILFAMQWANAQSVPAANRALIVITELDATGMPELAGMYRTLENITIGLPTLPVVSNSYGQIVSLRNGTATLPQLRAQIRRLAAQSQVRAIDVILALHGSDDRLSFRDGRVNMANMRDFLLEGPADVVDQQRRKLRLMYNTSCFGATHRQAFRSVGFDVVIGAVGVNANSEAEYPSFLALWNLNNSVNTALAPTNNPAALVVTDGPLVTAGRIFNNFLRNVNSRKVTSGNVDIKISTPAQ